MSQIINKSNALLCSPENPILVPPDLYRSLFDNPSSSSPEIILQPTPFGARQPSIPTAKTITMARIATTEGTDKRYERSWLQSLKRHFGGNMKNQGRIRTDSSRLVRRGDVISVPVWIDKPLGEEDHHSSSSDVADSDHDQGVTKEKRRSPTGLAYFVVTSLSFEPLVPLEEDFRSSTSSKARAGELGCWIDTGSSGSTNMVVTGMERARMGGRRNDGSWHGIRQSSFDDNTP